MILNITINKLYSKIILLILMVVSGQATTQAQCKIEYTGSLCVGSVIEFDVTNSGYTSFSWDFGGVGTSTQKSPKFVFKTHGDYKIKVTLSDPTLGSCTQTINLTIKPSPKIRLILESPIEQCYPKNRYCFTDSTLPASGSSLTEIMYLFSDGELYDFRDTLPFPINFCKNRNPYSFVSGDRWYDVTVIAYDINGCEARVEYDSIAHIKGGALAELSGRYNQPLNSDSVVVINQIFIRHNVRPSSAIGIEDVAYFMLDLGDTTIIGDSVTNTQFWTGKYNDGSLWTFKDKGEHKVTMIVESRTGCRDTSILNFKIYGSRLSGVVFLDSNGNGKKDVNERGLPAKLQLGERAAFASSNGEFSFSFADSISGFLNLKPENILIGNFQDSIKTNYTINIDNFLGDTTGFNFPVPMSQCPMLMVDIQKSSATPCQSSPLRIVSQNLGGSRQDSVILKVTIPDSIYLISSTEPYNDLGNGQVEFRIGSLLPGQADTIFLSDSVPCKYPKPVACYEAAIMPVNECLMRSAMPKWDHSDLEVTGKCTGQESVRFTITNTGDSAMLSERNYYIYTDEDLAFQRKFRLDAKDSLVIEISILKTGNVSLVAEQPHGHPYRKYSAVQLKECTVFTGSQVDILRQTFNTKKLFQNAVTCVPVGKSTLTNRKTVTPTGIGNTNRVQPGTRLTYRIEFQNEDPDNPRVITVEDQLSEYLDENSVEILGNSHEYHLEIVKTGNAATLVFKGIVLQGYRSDPDKSRGYIEFQIAPKPDLEEGTKIRNNAIIKDPSISWTNTTESTFSNPFKSRYPIIVRENYSIVQMVEEYTMYGCGPIFTIVDKRLMTHSGTYVEQWPTTTNIDSFVIIYFTLSKPVITTGTNDNRIWSQDKRPGVTYRWLDCDKNYSVIPGETADMFTASHTGRYAVEVTYQNCTDTSDCVFIQVLDVSDIQSHSINVYPNPNHGTFTIVHGQRQFEISRITDIIGREIYFDEVTSGNNSAVTLQNATSGVYFLNLRSDNHSCTIRLLIK